MSDKWWKRVFRSAREGRRARERVVARATEEARRCDQEANTAWWVTGEGDVALVRFDPVIQRFFLDGRAWPDRIVLANYLRFCEREQGWAPLNDTATRRVRGWLGVGDGVQGG